MRRPEKALSAQFVRTVREQGKYFDGHGLFLRVDGNGAKSWVQRIVIRKKRTELGLGSASLVSLADARDAAVANRRMARAGGDPLQARRASMAVMTFEEASREVHRIHAPTWRNAKHAAQFISTLETYAFPHMGALRVPDVTSSDVLAVLTPIWSAKPETAKRVRQRIGTVMKWCIAKGWRLDNPAETISAALPRVDAKVNPHKSLAYDKVTECIEAIKASKAGPTTKLAIEFGILTAARAGEVRMASWNEFHLSAATWAISAEKMKAKRGHRVPLSARAIEIVEEARQFSDGSDLVFPGARRGRPLSDMTFSKLIKELGYPVDMHGFRSSFRTWVQDATDYPRELAEFALAHVVGDASERAYARSDLFERRRAMMDQWAIYLDKMKSEAKA